jgi:hypothetical protein
MQKQRATTLETMRNRDIAKYDNLTKRELKLVSCNFPNNVVKKMDLTVKEELFVNRSEFIRFAVSRTITELIAIGWLNMKIDGDD